MYNFFFLLFVFMFTSTKMLGNQLSFFQQAQLRKLELVAENLDTESAAALLIDTYKIVALKKNNLRDLLASISVGGGLSLEQQFDLRVFSMKVQRKSREEILADIFILFQESFHQDNKLLIFLKNKKRKLE